MRASARAFLILLSLPANRIGRLERLSRSSAKRQIARKNRDRAMEKHGASGRLAQEDWHQLRGTHHRRQTIVYVRASWRHGAPHLYGKRHR